MSGLSAASVVIGGDADAPGRIAAERAAAAFVANGREVRVIYPSGAAKDFNAELVGAVR
jgi:phosphomannomutase